MGQCTLGTEDLGLYQVSKSSPKSRRPPTWSLIRLNFVRRVFWIEAQLQDALAIAEGVVTLGDWSSGGIDGWRNVDPDLPQKVKALASADARIDTRSSIKADDGWGAGDMATRIRTIPTFPPIAQAIGCNNPATHALQRAPYQTAPDRPGRLEAGVCLCSPWDPSQ